ncbi:hypothetical protein FKP32DRAFT_453465 [Trametes sanguinea]|nr:hypothetical protein FKP32DRAFT_453465 [Trametes sanguinea]
MRMSALRMIGKIKKPARSRFIGRCATKESHSVICFYHAHAVTCPGGKRVAQASPGQRGPPEAVNQSTGFRRFDSALGAVVDLLPRSNLCRGYLISFLLPGTRGATSISECNTIQCIWYNHKRFTVQAGPGASMSPDPSHVSHKRWTFRSGTLRLGKEVANLYLSCLTQSAQGSEWHIA